LKEAISSLIFASPRCSDLPELLQIRQLFAAKYGKEFAAAAAELRPECGVNRRVGQSSWHCYEVAAILLLCIGNRTEKLHLLSINFIINVRCKNLFIMVLSISVWMLSVCFNDLADN